MSGEYCSQIVKPGGSLSPVQDIPRNNGEFEDSQGVTVHPVILIEPRLQQSLPPHHACSASQNVTRGSGTELRHEKRSVWRRTQRR